MKRKMKFRVRLVFVLGIVVILVLTYLVFVVMGIVLNKTGDVSEKELLESRTYMLLAAGGSSLIIGTALATIYSRVVLKPVDGLIKGMLQLSKGDYSTRIDPKKYDYPDVSKIANMFNTLASELENTVLLREDFINSFSHEFKTPIASINGLIVLLKNDNLSKEKRKEYLSIIEQEMKRLLSMTSNILLLSKVESQINLLDIEKINISEQIRRCILLLNEKWECKNLNLNIDLDEYYLEGNNDLLENVWINLLDNAIKFANENGDINVLINEKNDDLIITIENTGSEIKEEDIEKIFDKFYQVDTTHFKEGNGVGLSIVKKIVELHKGTIDVISKENKTSFNITIPKEYVR